MQYVELRREALDDAIKCAKHFIAKCEQLDPWIAIASRTSNSAFSDAAQKRLEDELIDLLNDINTSTGILATIRVVEESEAT